MNQPPDTLRDEKVRIRQEFDAGKVTQCRCCGQTVKKYRRNITGAMAVALILLSKKDALGDDWIHVEDFLKDMPGLPSSIRGDVAKLRHWGLIEKKPEEREDGSPRNGYYKITNLGREFIKGEKQLPRHIFLYNNKLLGFDSEECTIKQCLGKKFDYNQLMSR